jgi:hypothetical protein
MSKQRMQQITWAIDLAIHISEYKMQTVWQDEKKNPKG